MNKLLLFVFVCFFVSFSSAQQVNKYSPPKSKRITKIINNQWTFNYFPDEKADNGFQEPGFDDSSWPAVSIPHTWSTYETTGEVHPFIRNAAEKDDSYWWFGWGWYRKHFSINKEYAKQKVFIEFEGVQKYCKVWVNGKYVGEHKGGYGSFDFEITGFLKTGEDNVLAVAVNNRMSDVYKIPPMAAGNFNVYGGIYRDVTLVLKDNLYIPMQGSASHEGGTFVTTPIVSETKGIARIQTWVKNDNQQPQNCTLKTYLVDANNSVVQRLEMNVDIKPGELFKFDQTSSPVKNPHLWSQETPYLYKVYSEVFEGTKCVDNISSPLGFRWFSWNYQTNFLYINDKKTIVHGGNRHQEYPWVGDALPKWITEMDFKDIAENLNYNFMRTAHYPNDKLVYALTDKYGIAVDEETPSIKNQVFDKDVQKQQITEAIRRDRNHPSIMFWSMGNETNHAVDSKWAIAEDTTRILTARRVTEGSAGEFVKHTDENLSIENLLRCTIRGWYNKDVKDLEPEDSQHSGTEEHQMQKLIESGRFGTGNLCTWLYEDHGCDREYLNSPLKHINPKGYVDAYRVPKYAYYFWEATYSKKPMVFILPHFWRTQYFGEKKDIRINSNCENVELKVNGVSHGFQFPNDLNFHSVTFKNIRIEQGTITAIGKKGDKTIATQVVMAGVPAKIVLTASHKKLTASRSSVAIITADIVDANGVHVYGATNTVKWTLNGPATLVGPSVYESDINKHEEMDGVMYTDMPVSNVIRATDTPGTIKVTVTATGLAAGVIELQSVKESTDNAVIIEPVLTDDNRKPVIKNSKNQITAIPVPQEMNETTDEINLKSTSVSECATYIRAYIFKRNPSLDSTSMEFKTLVDLFASHLASNMGRLVADDYNFSVEHFNKCRYINKCIDSTQLPVVFKNALKKNYAQQIIKQGMDKNIASESAYVKSMPKGGCSVVIVNAQNTTESGIQKSTRNAKVAEPIVYTNLSELSEIVALVMPQFNILSEDKKAKTLVYISSINPFIKVSVKSDQSREGDKKKTTTVTYKVEKQKLILIPELQ